MAAFAPSDHSAGTRRTKAATRTNSATWIPIQTSGCSSKWIRGTLPFMPRMVNRIRVSAQTQPIPGRRNATGLGTIDAVVGAAQHWGVLEYFFATVPGGLRRAVRAVALFGAMPL